MRQSTTEDVSISICHEIWAADISTTSFWLTETTPSPYTAGFLFLDLDIEPDISLEISHTRPRLVLLDLGLAKMFNGACLVARTEHLNHKFSVTWGFLFDHHVLYLPTLEPMRTQLSAIFSARHPVFFSRIIFMAVEQPVAGTHPHVDFTISPVLSRLVLTVVGYLAPESRWVSTISPLPSMRLFTSSSHCPCGWASAPFL